MPAEDVFLRIVLFRLFSKERTWEALEKATGGVRRATPSPSAFADVLDDLPVQGADLHRGLILSAHDAYGYPTKHRNHLDRRRMFAPEPLGPSSPACVDLGDVYAALCDWPMIGEFMSYQLAVDLNYTDRGVRRERLHRAGPGAVRGLHKSHRLRRPNPTQLIMGMVERQHDQFDRLGLFLVRSPRSAAHAIDCQGLFCETDKYARAAFPDLKSNRVRIKQEFNEPQLPRAACLPGEVGPERSARRFYALTAREPSSDAAGLQP